MVAAISGSLTKFCIATITSVDFASDPDTFIVAKMLHKTLVVIVISIWNKIFHFVS